MTLLERDARDSPRSTSSSPTRAAGQRAARADRGAGRDRQVRPARRAARAARRPSCACSPRARRELEREFAFGVVRQLFEADVGRARRASRSPAPRRPPRAVFAARARATARRGASFAALHGLYWLTLNLAAERPLLLAVDDLHWCDRPSLRFLAYLARRLDGVPVLVGGDAAQRRAAATDPALLAEIAHDPATLPLRPGPLGRGGGRARSCARELGDDADPAFCAACHDATGGNPLLLRQLLRTLEAEGVAPGRRARRRRPRRRPARRRQHRAAAARPAAAPTPPPSPARSACSGESAELPVVAALAGARRAGASPARPARSCARRSCAPSRRSASSTRSSATPSTTSCRPPSASSQHERAARALRDAGAPAEQVAAQLLMAPRARRAVGGRAAARRRAGAAMRRARPTAPSPTCARALEEPPPPERRDGVLLALGLAEAHDERAGRGRAPAGGLRPARRPGRAGARSRSALGAHAAVHRPRAGGGAAAARRAARRRCRRELRRPARAAARRSSSRRVYFGDGDRGAARAAARAPRRGAPARRSAPARADRPRPRSTGRTAASPPDACAAAALARARGRRADRRVYQGGAGPDRADDRARAGPTARRRSTRSTRCAPRRTAAARCSPSTALHLWRGFALLRARRPRRRPRSWCAPPVENTPHVGLRRRGVADVHPRHPRRRPASSAATSPARAGGARRRPWRRPGTRACASGGSARLAAARRPRATTRRRSPRRDELARALRAGRRTRRPSPWRSLRRAGARAARPRARRRSRSPRRSSSSRARWGAPGALGRALRVLGTLERRRDGPARGSRRRSRCSTARRRGWSTPRRSPRSGAALRRGAAAGRRARAAAPRARARRRLRRDRAGRARAHRALRRRRAAAHRRARPGVAALTASERRVADLAAAGETNRDIAQALYVTPKTVEVHLSNAYRKLGIRSRRELPGALGAA